MLTALLIAAGVNSVPQPGVPERDLGPLYKPCIEREDSAAGIGGGVFRTGIHDCTFVLTDPAHGALDAAVEFTFREGRVVPLDEDLADLSKLKELPETPDGNNWRNSLHLGGDFESYRKPRFQGEAEFYVMPVWKDAEAQDASVVGHDWGTVAGTSGLRCEATGTTQRCRAIARHDDKLFVVAIFRPRSEPVATTLAALKAFVADW